ncbi:type II toxin-antitoxin system VapC family toxin [Aerosakkonemataceae cyanobacterium BLCC-F154]|uniref:Type II toxin-antitoxin system VapC family toxin n=1 Tax=Floridaenema fluviatile BLCC-F154 TaxID=3153640 RepID=A0ABV4YJJ6_9CYAN
MNKFVVDANVAIKWVLPEIHTDSALRLLNNSYTLLVPDFFFPEIGNIFWKQVRRGEMSLAEAQEKFAELSLVDFKICASLPLMPLALEVAVRIDQAVYDCVYLALAVTNQCQMVTADERFYNALQGDALANHLRWVVDVP